jgi:hypothetical protein
MEHEIKKLDEVWTADGKRLGVARTLFHRQGDADPALKLYRSYLGVTSFDYGDDYYVPTDFIAAYDGDQGRVTLSVTLQKVQEYTWSRLPGFVASGMSQREELAAG